MNEDDTTSSSRIFVKIMMQEVTKSMGLPTLKERFLDPEIKRLCTGMFPLDNPKNTRFSINYFTSVGPGALTKEMREHLKVGRAFEGLFITELMCCSLGRASPDYGTTAGNVRGRVIVFGQFIGRRLIRSRQRIGCVS